MHQEPQHYPFQLLPLPYPYDALEPHIDTKTMTVHHDRHLKTYVDNLNKALAPYPEYHGQSLERLLKNIGALPESLQIPVKNNAGGVYNHNLYFRTLGPNSSDSPGGALGDAIGRQFSSFQDFAQAFKQSALGQFGSGYTWLTAKPDGTLRIVNTANQDTPLPYSLCPVLLIDVWEHAYYLKHLNLRADYIDAWFHVVNWSMAEHNYRACTEQPKSSQL